MRQWTKLWTSLLLLPLLCCGCGATANPSNAASSVATSSLEASSASEQGQFHTVTFDSNGGSAVELSKVQHGEKVAKPSDPTRNGYSFVRWEYDGEEWAFKGYVVTEDMVLKAVWKTVSYTISYGDVETSNPKSYTIEDEITLTDPSVDAGYTFEGWYNEEGNKVTSIAKGTTGNLTFTARFSGDPYYLEVAQGIFRCFEPIEGMKQAGEEISLSIASDAPDEYRFYGWQARGSELDNAGDKEILSYESEYSFKMPKEELHLYPSPAWKITTKEICDSNRPWSGEGVDFFFLEGWVSDFTSPSSFFFIDKTSGALHIDLKKGQQVHLGDHIRIFVNSIIVDSSKTYFGATCYKPVEILEQGDATSDYEFNLAVLGLPSDAYYAIWEWNDGEDGHWLELVHDEIYYSGRKDGVGSGHMWFKLSRQNYIVARFSFQGNPQMIIDWSKVQGKTVDYKKTGSGAEWVIFSQLEVSK